MSNHKLVKVKFQDNHGNEYNGYICSSCEYAVVAYPPLDRESMHNPNYRMILVKAKDLTVKDCEKYFKQYGVECDSGKNNELFESFKVITDRKLMKANKQVDRVKQATSRLKSSLLKLY